MDIAHIHFILALLATLNPIWKVGQRNNSKLLNIEWIYLIAVIKWKSIGNARIFEGVYSVNVVFLDTHSLPHLMPLKWVLFYSKTEISRIEHFNHKIFTGATFSPPFFSLHLCNQGTYHHIVSPNIKRILFTLLSVRLQKTTMYVFLIFFLPFW